VHLDLDAATLGFSINGDFKGAVIQNLPKGQELFPSICMYYKVGRVNLTILSARSLTILRARVSLLCPRQERTSPSKRQTKLSRP
jgi:hypothetical protein